MNLTNSWDIVKERDHLGGTAKAARAWGVSERTVRDWCRLGRKVREAEPQDPVVRVATESRLKREHRQLVTEVSQLRERIAIAEGLQSSPPKPIKAVNLGSAAREGAAVILCSDWHVEEPVAPTAYWPHGYNLNEADKRIGRLWAGAEWLIKFHRPVFLCREVVLWLGGDLMTGNIHEELRETSALAPLATLEWLRDRIVAGIDRLLGDRKIDRVTVVCSYGNHGRTTEKRRVATGAEHSYEFALYWQLARHYEKDARAVFVVEPSAHQYLKVYDFDLHFHHGDDIAYGGGVGGISVPGNKAVAQWDKWRAADYHHFGHFHQYLDLGAAVFNGSLIGPNAYAMSIKATPEPPQQAFYILDSKRGKTCKSPIWVMG